MRHVDLCSGIGGFALGFEWAGLSHPVQFCDIEPWSRKILKKHWPDVPIAEDVKELASDPDRNVFDCDILSAGYPCQPFSVAGRQKGFEDDRHIWPYIREIVAHKRPTWCVFENVYGHVALGLDQVLADLEAEGYSTRTFIVPACGVNAPHRRDRLWIVAHSTGNRDRRDTRKLSQTNEQAQKERSEKRLFQSDPTSEVYREDVGNAKHDGSSTAKVGGVNEEDARGSSQGQIQTEQPSRASGREDDVNVADTKGIIQNGICGEANQVSDRGNSRLELECGSYRQFSGESEQNVADTSNEGSQGRLSGRSDSERQSLMGHSGRGSSAYGQSGENWWAVEPDVGRVADGIPRRVDRLKGLGNAIVPQIAMQIGLAIKEELK